MCGYAAFVRVRLCACAGRPSQLRCLDAKDGLDSRKGFTLITWLTGPDAGKRSGGELRNRIEEARSLPLERKGPLSPSLT